MKRKACLSTLQQAGLQKRRFVFHKMITTLDPHITTKKIISVPTFTNNKQS